MGAAQTGTGKTAAFTVPILHRLMPLANASASPARHPVRALILTPTRELADQVYESVKRYSKRRRCVRPWCSAAWTSVRSAKLRRGCEILVATPGRLLDHVEQKNVNLGQVGILVLDEADRMLDMGFLPDLERIIRLLPAQPQGLLFSATFSNEIRKLGRSYLNQPVEIEVAARNATANTITQIAYKMSGDNKRAAVVHLVKSRGLKQVIVFSNTKIGTARLARQLERDGVKAESIHGDKTQADRMKALEAFKAGDLEVLVATDVAARGLDVAGVPCVINYDLPYNAEDYVHRIGRTGRAGASGEAIALFTAEEERFLLDIEADQARSAARHAGRARRPDRPQPWPWRGAARRARSRRTIVASVAIAAVRPSADPSAARRIPRRASPWTISSSSPTSRRPPGPPRTRRSSRTAPSARSPCCSAAAAPEGASADSDVRQPVQLATRAVDRAGHERRLAGAFSYGGSQAVSSGRQQRWQVGQAGRDGGAACVQAGKQAFEMADVRQHRTVEQHAVAELDQQGGKFSTSSSPSSSACSSISIQANTRSGMASASASSRLVLLAGVAPGGAETGDEPGVGRRAQARAQSGKIGTGNE